MTEPSPTPGIRAALNGAGELELTMVNAPAGAVIRMDVNAASPRMLCTQGRYLAPVQAPPGTRIRFRLFQGKRGLTAPETFIMPGALPAQPVPSTLIPCTQNRDFMIYDWAARHEPACRAVRKTHRTSSSSETPSRISGEGLPWTNRTGTSSRNLRKPGACARRE